MNCYKWVDVWCNPRVSAGGDRMFLLTCRTELFKQGGLGIQHYVLTTRAVIPHVSQDFPHFRVAWPALPDEALGGERWHLTTRPPASVFAVGHMDSNSRDVCLLPRRRESFPLGPRALKGRASETAREKERLQLTLPRLLSPSITRKEPSSLIGPVGFPEALKFIS